MIEDSHGLKVDLHPRTVKLIYINEWDLEAIPETDWKGQPWMLVYNPCQK